MLKNMMLTELIDRFSASLQFMFTVWIGIFGFFYGVADRVANTTTWRGVMSSFHAECSEEKGW
jgi:hypothetical protein